MKYEVKNLKENKIEIVQLGSRPRFVTESIEFDLLVITERASAEGHLKIEPMMPTDFQEYVKRIANKIARDIEEKAAIKLDSIEMNIGINKKCPECGDKLEFGSDETNFINMYWCDNCEKWFIEDELNV